MGVTHIRSIEAAQRLAADLNSGSRDRPYVVVSTPAARPSPYIDAEAIFDEVGDLARVYVLPTGTESRAFSAAMPPLTQVYGGAGRAYPVGTSWVLNPYVSPLRFAFDMVEGQKATGALIADALRMSNEAGLLLRSKYPPVDVDAEVKSIVPPSRAIVRTSDGRLASVWLELLLPDADVDQVFRVGMRLHGSLDPATKRFDVSKMLVPYEEALGEYHPGDVVLVQVVGTSDTQATLRLHPQVETTVRREDVTSNELDRVSSLMTVGEVLAARVVEPAPTWRLSLLDVDDNEEPKPAPSLLPDGPPWLAPPAPILPISMPEPPSDVLEPIVLEPDDLEPQSLARADEPQPEAPGPPPAAGRHTSPSPLMLDRNRRAPRLVPESELTSLRQERDKAISAELRTRQHNAGLQRDMVDLRTERRLLHNELERVKAEARRLDAELRLSRTELRKARRQARRTDRRGHRERRFLDREEDFRHEVHLAWVTRVPAAEKADRPLPEYSLGREFLASVDRLDGIDPSKIADVAFEVVCGLAERLRGRDMHQLRESRNGDAPAVVREDGAKCWRVALQVNTPQARRLHFWRLPNGRVELSRVTVHDDFTP